MQTSLLIFLFLFWCEEDFKEEFFLEEFSLAMSFYGHICDLLLQAANTKLTLAQTSS